ncbi:hypothetical protein [Ancylomarina longa]|uniref:Uncharacterized protein n=1 Tax=Ancylomarina longa TaxID=2487017 RepID=A0A434AV66_9BACT|nr:hypothetical protein [Ancylomarina longa]RUT78342.1 hypothetical protein DLK05_08425 [Ancylomarina longa]
MSNVTDFETVQEKLLAIQEENIDKLGMPVDIYLQEAEDKSYYATKDKELLVANGLAAEYIDSLPARIGALQYTQSEWKAVSKSKTEMAKQWSEVSENAEKLHRELLHEFRFAYRNDKELKAVVDDIADGNGYADMVQDFSDLCTLGKKHPDFLTAIYFDTAKLDKAAEFADILGPMVSSINGERNENDKPAKEMRDRAYTYLKEAIDQISDFGKFVFWEDEEKLEKYASAYFRKLRKQKEEEDEAAKTL